VPRVFKAEELLVKYLLLATSIGVVDEVLCFIIRKREMSKYGMRGACDLEKLVKSRGIGSAREPNSRRY